MSKLKYSFFKKHLSFPVRFGKRPRQVNYGLIIVVIMGTFVSWWLGEYIVYQLKEMDVEIVNWISEMRPLTKAQSADFQPSNRYANNDVRSHLNWLKHNENNSKYMLGVHVNQVYDWTNSDWNSTVGQVFTDTGHYPAFTYWDYRHDDDSDGDFTLINNKVISDYNNNVYSGLHPMLCSPFSHVDINNDNSDTSVLSDCRQEDGHAVIPSGYTLADIYTHPGNPVPNNPGNANSAYATFREALIDSGRGVRDLLNNGVNIVYWTYLRTEQEGCWFWPARSADTRNTGDGDGSADDADCTLSSHYQGAIRYEHNFFENSHWVNINSKSGTYNTYETLTMYTNSDCSSGATGATGIHNLENGSEMYLEVTSGSLSAGDWICGDNSGARAQVTSIIRQGLPNMIFNIRTSHYQGDGWAARSSLYHNLAGLEDYVDIVGISHNQVDDVHIPGNRDQSTIDRDIEENQTDPNWTRYGNTDVYFTRTASPWRITGLDGQICLRGNACNEFDSLNEVVNAANGGFWYDENSGFLYLHTPDGNDPDTDDPITHRNRSGISVIRNMPDQALGSDNFIHMFGDVNNLSLRYANDADAYLDDLDTYYPSTAMIFHWRGCNLGTDREDPRLTTACWPAASAFVNDSRTIHNGNAVPDPPFPISPPDNAINVPTTPALQASAFYGPRAHYASQWQIDLNSDDFSSPVFDSGQTTSGLTQISVNQALDSNTNYKWRVRYAINVGGNAQWGNWSAPAIFTTGSGATSDMIQPVITAFDVQPRTATGDVTLSWTVTDSGGSHLDYLNIFQAPDINNSPGAWQILSALGQDLASQNIDNHTGSVVDTPSAGTWWYGLHAYDQAGNEGFEPDPPGPIRVVKTDSNANSLTFCDGFEDNSLDYRAAPAPDEYCFDDSWDCADGVAWGREYCQTYDPNAVGISTDQAAEGVYAVKVSVPDPNCRDGVKQRAEISGSICSSREPKLSEEFWLGFDVYIPASTPANQTFNVIHQIGGAGAQCGAAATSPTLQIAIINGIWSGSIRRCVSNWPSSPYTESVDIDFHSGSLMTDDRGKWVNIVYNYYPRSVEQGDGFFRVYKNGIMVIDYSDVDTFGDWDPLDSENGGTTYSVGAGNAIGYRKFGIYNSQHTGTEPMLLYYDNIRRMATADGGNFDVVAGQWPPDAPILAVPANGAAGISVNPSLQTDGSYYGPRIQYASQWQIDNSIGDFSSPVYDSGQTTSDLTQISINQTLSGGAIYKWRVRYAINIGGNARWGNWSAPAVFTTVSDATPCHLYTPSDPVQAGYGSAYNLGQNNPSELLVRTACNTDSVNLDVGNGNANMFVYERGHIYDGSNWQTVNLSGSNQPYTGWYAGNAGATNIPVANMSAVNYIVAYTCYWNGQSWRCGCADSACIDPCPGTTCSGKTGGLWQLQAFSQ